MAGDFPHGQAEPDPGRVATAQDFVRELTLARQRAGLTVREAAREAGIPVSTVGDYFSGRHLPAASQPGLLRGLLRACGITDPADEAKARAARYGYGGPTTAARGGPARETHQPHFGMLVASCERGDLRPSADGVLVYADDGLREIALPPGHSDPGRDAAIDELHRAVIAGIKPVHDGRFARGTVETCLAILRSARERREIVL